MSTKFEQSYCGLPQRKICIAIGILEIIINICLTVCSIVFINFSILYSLIILFLIIAAIISLVFGAINRKSDLFCPYFLLKFIIIGPSLGGLGICIFAIICYETFVLTISNYFDTEMCNFVGIFVFLPMAILFILNVIPLLIVKNYHQELKAIKNQEMTVTFNNVEVLQLNQPFQQREENIN